MKNIKTFSVIGIRIHTTNENGQSATDIGGLWERFIREQIADKIPNRIDGDILSVYCHYTGGAMQPYDNIIGCRVSSLDDIPNGMFGQVVGAGNYRHFTAKGNVTQGAVAEAWETIWQTDMPRRYTTDFEVYGEKAQNPLEAEVDIFIAVSE